MTDEDQKIDPMVRMLAALLDDGRDIDNRRAKRLVVAIDALIRWRIANTGISFLESRVKGVRRFCPACLNPLIDGLCARCNG